jgi:hypothetical protein
MIRRSTWIVLIVFALVAGFAWIFQHYQSTKAVNTTTTTPTAPPNYLYNLTDSEVEEIKISDQSGNAIDLYHDPILSKWAIADIPADQADSFQIESVSAQLFSLDAQDTLTQTLPIESIGLATPVYTITISTTEGTSINTYIGTETAIGSGYYARVDSGPVVIVSKTVMDNILELLKTPPLLPTATPEVTSTLSATPSEQESQVTPTP